MLLDDLEAIEFLVENGANVNAVNYFLRTPLHRAAERGNL